MMLYFLRLAKNSIYFNNMLLGHTHEESGNPWGKQGKALHPVLPINMGTDPMSRQLPENP